MKKDLIIAIVLGLAGIVFLGFVLSNAPMLIKTPVGKASDIPSPTAAQNRTQTFTINEVAKHASTTDCYMIVGENVFDVTTYLSQHPSDITMYCGTDATVAFTTKNGKGPHKTQEVELLNTMVIGTVTK